MISSLRYPLTPYKLGPRGNEAGLASLAVSPAGTTVVLVHGLGGGPGPTTWGRLVSLLESDPLATGYDLYAIRYDSMRSQVPICSAELAHFISAITKTGPTSLFFPSTSMRRVLQTREPVPTKKLLLVAHSLGAVIVREAFLAANMPPNTWQTHIDVRIALLAPAHKGAFLGGVSSGLLSGLPAWARAIAATIQWNCPALSYVLPSSDSIAALEKTTLAEMGTYGQPVGLSSPHVAELVLHAIGDKLVKQEPFGKDKPTKPAVGKDHTSICKPNAATDPVYTMIREQL